MAGPLHTSPRGSRKVLEGPGPDLGRGEGGTLEAFTCRRESEEGSGAVSKTI